MPLQPIEREKSLGEHAYVRLKVALMTGVFKPNEKITVRSIADSFNISITPARDALSRLIAERVLETTGPKTVIVPPLNGQVLKEVTKIRLALEGLAAETATPNVDERDLSTLEEVQEKLNNAMDRQDYTGVLAHNETFHFIIYKKAHMPTLLSIIESQWLRIGPSLNLLYPEFSVNRPGKANHIEIIGGLHRGEPSTVRAAIEKDIRDGFDTLNRAIPIIPADKEKSLG